MQKVKFRQKRSEFVFFAAELQKRHEQEKSQLTETFQAAENVLKVRNRTNSPLTLIFSFVLTGFIFEMKDKVEELTADLQVYNDLKRRVGESTFKKDLQRNIQVCTGACVRGV